MKLEKAVSNPSKALQKLIQERLRCWYLSGSCEQYLELCRLLDREKFYLRMGVFSDSFEVKLPDPNSDKRQVTKSMAEVNDYIQNFKERVSRLSKEERKTLYFVHP